MEPTTHYQLQRFLPPCTSEDQRHGHLWTSGWNRVADFPTEGEAREEAQDWLDPENYPDSILRVVKVTATVHLEVLPDPSL